MKFFSLFLFFIISKPFFSQNDLTGAVIYFEESNVIAYVDGVKIEVSKKMIPLKEGIHKISVWAPTYNLFEDSFKVVKGKTTFFTRHLKHTHEYKYFVLKKNVRKASVVLPLGLTVLSAGAYFLKVKGQDKDIQKSYDEAMGLKSSYELSFSPEEFETNFNNYNSKVNYYEKQKIDLEKLKKQGVIVTSALAVTSVTSIIVNKLLGKMEFKEKALLTRITPSFNPLNKQVCLIIQLK